MKKANLERIINGLNRFFRLAAKHSLSSLLILSSIALLLGGILFYKYSVLAGGKEPEIVSIPIEFKETLYQQVLAEWQKRGERFEAAKAKEYPDPFR